MTAPSVERTAPTKGSDRRRIVHAYCLICLSRVAMCGHISGSDVNVNYRQKPGDQRCVVCEDLYDAPCPTCGS
jgi:hypothetical protein